MNTNTVVNVASVPHRSPFRYPGGKTWLVPHVRKWLKSLPNRPNDFVEPFAGGGIVGLSMLFDGLTDHTTLIELDEDIAAVWRVILNGEAKKLAEQIESFEVSVDAVRSILDTAPINLLDQAFATIIRNRMQRGGIMAKGASLMKNGENGKGLLSRWYPETLKQRILDISSKKESINFIAGDGIEYLKAVSGEKDICCLIDPPYTVAGKRLYAHADIDHEGLFRVTSKIKGDFLMTYDNAEPVLELAKKFGFDTQTIAMKNTHHSVMSELLIGRNLQWVR